MTEHDEQVALFRWASLQSGAHPELRLMYAIPNGGQRHIAVAAKLKAEGVKAGVPDICLPVPRGGFGALYIELKAVGGRLSAAQTDAMDALRKAGNAAYVAFGWNEASQVLSNYLALDCYPA